MLGAIQSGVLGGVRGPISLRALSGSPDQRPEEQSCCPEESETSSSLPPLRLAPGARKCSLCSLPGPPKELRPAGG